MAVAEALPQWHFDGVRKAARHLNHAWCSGYQKWLPVDRFTKHSNRENGVQIFCKEHRKKLRRLPTGGDSSNYRKQHKHRAWADYNKARGIAPGERVIYIIGGTRTAVALKIGFSNCPDRRRQEVATFLGLDVGVLRTYLPVENQIVPRHETDLHAAIERAGFYRQHGTEVFSRSAFEAKRLIRFVDDYAKRHGWERLPDVGA